MKKMTIGIVVFGLLLLSLDVFAIYEKDVVLEAQKKLSQKGFNPGPIDGLFGPNTRKAIAEFQKENKIAVTRDLDFATLNKLGVTENIDDASSHQTEIEPITAKPPWMWDKPNNESSYKLALIDHPTDVISNSEKKETKTGFQKVKEEFFRMIGPRFLLNMLFLGIVLEIYFFRRKKYIENENLRKGVGYYFYLYSLEFLVPFTIILSAYYIMCGLVSYSIDSTTLNSLVKLEQFFEKIKVSFSIFKLTALQAMGVLVFLYLLNFVRLFSSKTGTLFNFFDKYQIFVRRTYIVIVLLASFTLFGTQIGNPTSAVTVKINTIRNGYADIVNDTAEIISQEVFPKLFEKTKKSFPETYIHAFHLPVKLYDDAADLKIYYQEVNNKYGIEDNTIVMIYGKYLAPTHINNPHPNFSYDFSRIYVPGQKIGRAVEIPTLMAVAGREGDINLKVIENKGSWKKISPEKYPGSLSFEKVQSMKAEIASCKQRIKARAIELMKIPGGKKIVLYSPKLITSQIKTSIFRPLIENIPILGPLIDVFCYTLDKKLEDTLNYKAEKMLNSSGENKGDYLNKIKGVSSSIVHDAEVNVTEDHLRYAEIERNVLYGDVKEIINANKLIEVMEQVSMAEILIGRLRDATDDSFFEIRNQLSTMREKLAPDKIKEISFIENSRISIIIDGLAKSDDSKYDSEYARLGRYEELLNDRHRARIKVIENRHIFSIIDRLEKSDDSVYESEYARLMRDEELLTDEHRARISSIENTKFDVWLEQLENEDEVIRENASIRLVDMGDRLDQRQVNRIVNFMRNSDKTYKKYLYRQSHCSWYEYTTQKYYAAKTLSRINSPYIDSAVKQEATIAVTGGKKKERVMDAGWV